MRQPQLKQKLSHLLSSLSRLSIPAVQDQGQAARFRKGKNSSEEVALALELHLLTLFARQTGRNTFAGGGEIQSHFANPNEYPPVENTLHLHEPALPIRANQMRVDAQSTMYSAIPPPPDC